VKTVEFEASSEDTDKWKARTFKLTERRRDRRREAMKYLLTVRLK
jgi:hypothetical protein